MSEDHRILFTRCRACGRKFKQPATTALCRRCGGRNRVLDRNTCGIAPAYVSEPDIDQSGKIANQLHVSVSRES